VSDALASADVRPHRSLSAWAAVALVVVAFAASALVGVPGQALSKASQARAWIVAKAMAESGDLAIPRYHGETRLKKPPLQSWAQVATMKAIGSADLWAAGLGTWIVGILFALGPWLIGRTIGKPEAGLVGSLLLCASRAAITWGGSPEHDVPFAGWTALSWALLARALSDRGRLRDVIASGLACGAALLTKDPFVLAFVPGTALVLRWRASSRGPVRSLPFWTALLGATLLPALGWLAIVATRLGSVSAVFDEMWRQASGSEGAHTKPLLTGLVYYIGAVPKTLLPWSPIAIVTIVILLIRRRRGDGSAASLWLAFPTVAFLVGFVVLTVVPAKQEHYVLPILVPAALLAGHAFVEASRADRRVARALPWAFALAGVSYAVTRWFPSRAHYASVAVPLVMWGELAVVVGVSIVIASRRAIAVGLLVAAAAMGVGSLFDGVQARAVEDYRDSVATSLDVLRDGVPVVGFAPGGGEAFDVVVAWLDNPYERVRSRDDLSRRLDRGDPLVVMVRATETEDLGAVAARLTRRGMLTPRGSGSSRDSMVLFESAAHGPPR
jgi:4-amino-4-deoxy-L-arabinose transferase-like glycosyltransferase